MHIIIFIPGFFLPPVFDRLWYASSAVVTASDQKQGLGMCE